MRSHEKKRYHDGLIILKELCSQLTASEGDNLFEVLSDCQQYIVALGNELEKESHKEDVANLISKLENFAEQMYTASEGDFSGNCAQMLVNEAQDIIELLEIVPCRKEIVFLPYKASMWDAFDSVYQAAVQDLNVNVVVMPIPYRSFDKKSGSWNEHYEGELFPENIQITDYREYNLEVVRPDLIFIHNPYDQYNRVTRVHEEFFSSNLIKYTDHLVYIPYDVVLGSKIDENYCKMPGVQNAWRVIVQSESIREEYIKWTNPEKVLALGSPKIDAVVNYKVDWNQMPDSWKEKRANKKVFLYNTHLSGIISDGYLLIKRLQNVWEYFHEHQEITLLWRPHPLSVQTAEAMNPDFLQSYLQMVDKFKNLCNCIYDDTPDLNRAIGLSDAYMGDYSSLVMLYGFTGKPIYVHSPQNRNMGDIERNSLLCDNGVIHEGYFWMTHNLFNGLFKVDVTTGKAEFVTEIYGENRNQENLFCDIFVYSNKLILIPQTANHIVEYDIITGVQRSIEVVNNSNCSIHFSAKLQVGDYIYMFPLKRQNNLLILDARRFEVEEVPIDYLPIDPMEADSFLWRRNAIYVNNSIWIPVARCGKVAKITERDIEVYDVDERIKGFCYIEHDGENFWLASMEGSVVVCWNVIDGVKREIIIRSDLLEPKGNYIIQAIHYFKNKLWIVPNQAQNIVCISEDGKEQKQVDVVSKSDNVFKDYVSHFCGSKVEQGILFLYPYRLGNIIKINLENEEVIQTKVFCRENCNKWRFDYIYNDQLFDKTDMYTKYMYLDSNCTLDDFAKVVIHRKEEISDMQKAVFDKLVDTHVHDSGKKIYEAVINM